MDEKVLKTSLKQRIFIGLIALILLGSTLAVYVAIVMSGNGNSTKTSDNSKEIEELTAKMEEIGKKIEKKVDEFSDKYLEEMKGYKSRVRSFNAQTAEEEKLVTKDLKEGDGAEITTEFNDYYAYYIGWCSDEKVFDSSFDPSFENPASLKEPLSGQMGLITGWTEGVQGMKLGGVREISVPSELGYKEQDVACGANTPMKFVILAFDPGEEYRNLYDEYTVAYYQMSALQGQ